MTTDQQLDDDARGLAELGYAQELRRGMSAFSNFAISSIISILAGCITSYRIALVSAGPSALTLGWLIVGLMVLAVALAMAEICSRYPTAGGLYFCAWGKRTFMPGSQDEHMTMARDQVRDER